jgi:hypothetical protein
MEKRAVAPLVLGGAGLALVVAIVILLLKVRAGAPTPSVEPPVTGHAGAGSTGATPAPPPRPHVRPAGSEDEEGGAAQVGVGGLASPGETDGEEPGSLAEKMTEANRLYDHGDYEAAQQTAEGVLQVQPDNVKMLRIAASAACIQGNASEARVHYDKLPERDQQQIARRCRRYGVEF